MVDRDDIIKLAREAGIEFYPSPTNDVRFCLIKNLERFAVLVAAHEREACAKVCDDLIMSGPVCEVQQRYNKAYMDCRDKILSRGEQ